MGPTIDEDDRYARTCFVIMPYGIRDVGSAKVDFDRVYEDVFQPAIHRVRVDGKAMIPRRADESTASRVLMIGMIRDLLKSRLAIADLTIANENVSWELGLRHNAVRSGTVLLWLERRSKRREVPFDLASVMVSEYADTPVDALDRSIGSIAATLRATLKGNEVDSPAFIGASRLADLIGLPDAPSRLGTAIADAELAAISGSAREAASLYGTVVGLAPDQPLLYQRRGVLYMQSGAVELAQESFHKVLDIEPSNLDARLYLADLRGGRPYHVMGPEHPNTPALGDLLSKDGSLDLRHLLLAQPVPSGLMNVSIVAGDLMRGRYYSTVRVVGEPVQSISHVEEVCLRHGFAPRFGVDVPEVNRTIYAFDATSSSKSALQSAIGELEQELSGTPGIGKIEISGKFGGGGSGSSGGGLGGL